MPEKVNYREFFKAKLDDLNKQKVELDKKIREIGTIMDGLNEADRDVLRSDLFSLNSNTRREAKNSPTADAVVDCLKFSGQMMQVSSIRNHLSRERKISKQSIYYALNKLLKSNVVFHKKKLWGLVGQDSATSNEQ